MNELNFGAAYGIFAGVMTKHVIGLPHAALLELKHTSRDVYLHGVRDGIEVYAHWDGGVQYVGSCSRTLNDALKEFDPLENEDAKSEPEERGPSEAESEVAEIEIYWSMDTGWKSIIRYCSGGQRAFPRQNVLSLAACEADAESAIVAGALADLAAEVTGEHVSLFSIKRKRDTAGRVVATWTNEDADIPQEFFVTEEPEVATDKPASPLRPETIAIREVASAILGVVDQRCGAEARAKPPRYEYLAALDTLEGIAHKLLDKHGAEAASNKREQTEAPSP